MPKAPKTTILPVSEISETEKPEGQSGAERVAERLRGGAESGPAVSSTDRVRKFRAKGKPEAAPPKEISPAEEKEAGALFETCWTLIVVPLAKGRLAPMSGDQTERAGRVFAPVIQKYAPLLGEWRVEFMALVCVGMIVRECYIPEARVSEAEEAA